MPSTCRAGIRTNYEGFALWSTGTQFLFGPAYNHDIEKLEYDVEEAEDLLADAGWYDRDGNGIVDKDGEDLVIEVLMPSGNKASEKFLQALQDSYRKIGVKVEIQAYEWATMLEKILDRDFDAVNMAWVLSAPESDPYQLWHSAEAAFEKRSSNRAGLRDDKVDELIEAGPQGARPGQAPGHVARAAGAHLRAAALPVRLERAAQDRDQQARARRQAVQVRAGLPAAGHVPREGDARDAAPAPGHGALTTPT